MIVLFFWMLQGIVCSVKLLVSRSCHPEGGPFTWAASNLYQNLTQS